jgi:hypothetical protein
MAFSIPQSAGQAKLNFPCPALSVDLVSLDNVSHSPQWGNIILLMLNHGDGAY